MTEYQTIYEDFLDKVDDIEIANYDEDMLYEQLYRYLNSAIKKFIYCKKDLSERDTSSDGYFEADLDSMEVDILSEYMLVSWIKQKLNNLENVQNALSTSDFSFYSPANLLDKLETHYKDSRRRARTLMNEYSMIASDYDTWRN